MTSKMMAAEILVIVESPTKAKTLGKYLATYSGKLPDGTVPPNGMKFNIKASGGHIIDLPQKKIGVDVENNFQPEYVNLPGKTKTINDLKKAASTASVIYIATDPDREGEAIAWHINNVISKTSTKSIWRIAFNEITKKAVQEALSEPGKIDICKVDAQQARRVLDRLVGYKVSPLLWKTITRGLSAGRVQSVALRMICERQVEIDAFIKEEYWSLDSLFRAEKCDPFLAKLVKIDDEKAKIPDEETAKKLEDRINSSAFKITDIQKTKKSRNPAPPYITSTLQQDAARRHGFPVKRTMAIAQKLYEGIELGGEGRVGLITYMRTDSTRISDEANTNVRNFITEKFGKEYLQTSIRRFKNKKGAVQDAHEAIRPTDVNFTPERVKRFLTPQDYKLYELIWRRFVATQMKPASYDVTTILIDDGKGIDFRASGQIITFPGFLHVYGDIKTTNGNGDGNQDIPSNLEVGMPLTIDELISKQHFTQPPARFTEASLVKELDELGIGRPSTYSAIISTLFDRKYVDRLEKAMAPTELGQTVNKVLVDRFPDLFNVAFTAQMEEKLDEIETGKGWVEVVREFYDPFNVALEDANKNYAELKKGLVNQPVGKKCPNCGEELIYRWGRMGKFISCSGYPKCKYAENINQVAPIEVDIKCPKCEKNMLLREGRFGKFYGCSDYPTCKGVLPFTIGLKCPVPDCKGELSERKGKKGTFYGCSAYPDCKFITWDAPLAGPCPQCKAPTIFKKSTKTKGSYQYCSQCAWRKDEDESE